VVGITIGVCAPNSPLLLALTSLVTLAFAAPAAAKESVGEQAVKIETTEYKAQLAYKSSQVQTNLNGTQSKLASCGSQLQSMYDSASTTTAQSAINKLATELEVQYTADIAVDVLKPDVSALKALEKLKLSKKLHKEAVADAKYQAGMLSINTCADATAWSKADNFAGKEPADTVSYGGFFVSYNESIPVSLTFTSQRAANTFTKLANKANNASNDLIDEIGDDWDTWAQQFGIAGGV
jgi:hypothetical protein